MSYATKFNNGSRFTFKTSDDAQYFSLADLYNRNGSDHVYEVKSLFINRKSRFGDAPAVVIDKLIIVNLPKHLLPVVNEMICDPEFVSEVNEGKVSFKIYQYQETNFNKTCYSVNWL